MLSAATTRRRADVVALVGGLAVLLVCAIPASSGRVGGAERAVFEAVNGLPDTLEPAMVAAQFLGVLAIGIAYLVPNVLDLILYAYTFGAAGMFFPMLGLLFWRRTTASGAFWSMLAGGGFAIAWTIAGEPWGFAASYAGWVIGLPVLVIVSLATSHSPDENPGLFA